MKGNEKSALWFANILNVQLKTYIFQNSLLEKKKSYLHFPCVTEISEDSSNGRKEEENVRELGSWRHWDERDNDCSLFYRSRIFHISCSYL